MTMDWQQLRKILPHRYPFLLVDRVIELTADSIVGLKNVTINEPFFQGHFPEEPIMPGVLIIEAMAQTGGVLAFSRLAECKHNLVYFMGLDNVRFRKPVRPGDQLVMKLKLTKQRGGLFKMKGEAYVENQLVAEAELMATIDPPKTGGEEDAAGQS
jgi:3-hydroxyacyl-[acyl-carrier-protein] dehydratase